jgi:hypothetical protein
MNGRAVQILLFCAVSIILFPPTSSAHHQCLHDSVVTGLLAGKLRELRAANASIGCALSSVRGVPGAAGQFNDFENGQIVWSPAQKMLVTAFRAPNNSTMRVDWEITDQYHYDFFLVRAARDPGGEPNTQQQTVSGQSTRGSFTWTTAPPGELQGRYAIQIEGCDNGSLGSSDCKQGWSDPAFVDLGFLDVSHRSEPDGSASGRPVPMPPAMSVADTKSQFDERLRIAMQKSCLPASNGAFTGTLDEPYAATALDKLFMSDTSGVPGCDPTRLMKEANDALRKAKVTTEVGTDLPFPGDSNSNGWLTGVVTLLGTSNPAAAVINGLIASGGTAACKHSGDYDMALGALIPIAYRYRAKLATDVYRHILHDLLTVSGGADHVRSEFMACGVAPIPETENHVLNTEVARYLTNQLLLAEVEEQHTADPQNPAVAQARRIWGNAENGLDAWMLSQLQDFLRHDFHEYNARPYARLTINAVHNLAEYANTPSVQLAATMVLDYLAAKFAVSSSELRRAAPFRRHYDHLAYTPLFGNYSDEATWRHVTMSGSTSLLESLRYGRADWGSSGDMGYPAIGKYRVHDVIQDFIVANNANAPGQPVLDYFQAFRHEGVELYARTGDFLISAGGNFEDGTDRDKFAGLFGQDDTNGAALPTTLMPTFSGDDRGEFINIRGNGNAKKIYNTCVAPGFACGLDPRVPPSFLRQLRPIPRPCAYPVAAIILTKWQQLGGPDGSLGCPLADQVTLPQGGGASQIFERGQIVWSAPQKLVVAAFLKNGSGDLGVAFGLDWDVTDTFHYDFFIVRWDQNGINAGQEDAQGGAVDVTATSGKWTITPTGVGAYSIIVEGCDGSLTGAVCRQQWSSPITMNLPLPNSCSLIAVDGNQTWTFVDAGDQCGAPKGRGYYAVELRAPCDSGGPHSPCWFGFFEAANAHEMSFDEFRTRTLNNNRARHFTSVGTNDYELHDGRKVSFIPDRQSHEWGIVSYTPADADSPPIPADMEKWRLAKGSVIEADGAGCVLVRNLHLNRALVLDFRDVSFPKEFQAALRRDITCDAPPLGP